MGEIIDARDLPPGEAVYLKKDFIGWRAVEPWKIGDKIQWFNLLTGGKRNLLFLMIVMAITGILFIGINDLISSYKEIEESPCKFCESCHEEIRKVVDRFNSAVDESYIGDFNISFGGDNE